MIETYSWSGGSEHILRFGCDEPIQIILIQPFFEEANRLRHILTSVMRSLAERGIGTALPDLPGTGESETNIAVVSLDQWSEALKSAADHIRRDCDMVLSASFRSGALIDNATECSRNWRLSPEPGSRLVRDLMRTKLASATHDGTKSDHMMVAGHAVQKSLLDALANVSPATIPGVRTVRLETEAAQADARLAGSPVWRRSEPGDDPLLRAAILSDIESWVKTCAIS